MWSEWRYFRYLDYSVFPILIGLFLFSYLGISGATPGEGFADRQAIWYGIGLCALVILLFINYAWLAWLSPFLYGLGVALLIGVLFMSEATNGAVSWYTLPGGVKFQPAEVMKICLILFLAYYFSRREVKGKTFEHFYQLLPSFAIMGLPLVLILLQPDLGTALVFFAIFFSMLLTAKVRWLHLAVLLLLALLAVAALAGLYFFEQDLFFKLVDEYQWNRIISFINPEADPWGTGYQLNQSLIAVGSGQLIGKGLYQGTQGKYQWVPEGHTDFVFSVIAEEHGFLGASLLVLLFFFLFYRLIHIAVEAKDNFGVYVISGIVGMWIFHIFENVGMTIGLMPITGIPLPFVSYGGSSILANFIALAVILNVGMRRKKLIF